jgi:hypothetical protein
MPYKIIPEQNGLLTKWWGTVTSSEMIRMQEQVHALPDFAHLNYSIHDFSECNHFTYSENDVEYSAAIDGEAAKTNNQILIAVVGGNPEVWEVVNSYVGFGLSPYPVRVFFSMDDARAWVT